MKKAGQSSLCSKKLGVTGGRGIKFKHGRVKENVGLGETYHAGPGTGGVASLWAEKNKPGAKLGI